MINKNNLKDIPDGKPVKIFLPLINSNERYRSNCVFQRGNPPNFSLNFKLGELPQNLIDTGKPCLINIDMGGTSVSLEANISEIASNQTLNLMACKTIDHEQLREFFRVDATTRVVSKAFKNKNPELQDNDWHCEGTTVDISGSGLLASFSSLPPMDNKVQLEIILPGNDEQIIKTMAIPIRSRKIKDDLYEVAYHFEEISSEDRDLIIGSCLVIQRQLLRMKVQVSN